MQSTQLPPRKRRRPALACTACRRRKVGCDHNNPCGQCMQSKSSCVYGQGSIRPPSVQNQRMTAVENALGREFAPVRTCSGERPSNQASFLGPRPDAIVTRQASGSVLSTTCSRSAAPQQTSFTSDHTPTAPPEIIAPENSPDPPYISGTLNKTRLFGRSHWMNIPDQKRRFGVLNELSESINDPNAQPDGSKAEIIDSMKKCKALARRIKVNRPSRASLHSSICQVLPHAALMDRLVQNYLGTFETNYRILHVPSFLKEYNDYKNEQQSNDAVFLLIVLLVMSIGASLQDQPDEDEELRAKILNWIQIAQSWLSGPVEKDRLTISGLQINCLLLLARQVNCIGPDLIWVSAGSLMRMAMQMGLHRDPNQLRTRMTTLQAEVRRRLWYTILELNIHAALDAGMPPVISVSDYTTQLPLNLDDDQINNSVESDVSGEPDSKYTQSSFQRLLASSLSVRYTACKTINDLHHDPSYSSILNLSSELATVCRQASHILNSYQTATQTHKPTQSAKKLLLHHLRRFLFCLHRYHAILSLSEPLYHYSFKTCLDCAIATTTLLESRDIYPLLCRGGSMYRDIINHCAVFVLMDLIKQLEGDDAMSERNRARRQPLLDDARRIVTFAEDRMKAGETNTKGYVFGRMAMGQVEAMEAGLPARAMAISAAKEGLRVCREILEARAVKVAAQNGVNVSPEDSGFGETPGLVQLPETSDLAFDFLQSEEFGTNIFESWLVQDIGGRLWV